MHSKQTVKYICEQFSSGGEYFYKQECITHDKWANLNSLAWSTPRPISKTTFLKREAEGYSCHFIKKESAAILTFSSTKKALH